MGTIATEVLIIVLLILANGVFAMSEAAVVASRKARLQQRADSGDKRAEAALALAENPNRFLSTVQIGITLIGIFSGAFGGATLSRELAMRVREVPALAPYADSIGLGLVVLAITYFSLIVGELVPKRLALAAPENIASFMARPMGWVSRLTSPFVTILAASTDLVLRLLGQKPSTDPPVTEEEIKVMIEQGTQAGVFDEREQDMVERVFRLGDRKVASLMTRRPDIQWLDLARPMDENKVLLRQSPYSRLPVCDSELDKVVGITRAKELLDQLLSGAELDIVSGLQTPLYVPESQRALRLLEVLRAAGTHIALVVDEHGATVGLVTLHDLLEAITGDMPNTNDAIDSQALQRDDGSWLLDGLIAIDEFKHRFELDELPGEEDGNFETLSGFLMAYLGRIPTEGDSFVAAGLKFEVVDMDGHRVDKVLVIDAGDLQLPSER